MSFSYGARQVPGGGDPNVRLPPIRSMLDGLAASDTAQLSPLTTHWSGFDDDQYPSPSSSSDGMFSANSSRETSLSAGSTTQRGSVSTQRGHNSSRRGPARASPCSRSSRGKNDIETRRSSNDVKTSNARRDRKDQGWVLGVCEDHLGIAFGWQGRTTQKPANGRSSGLQIKKHETELASTAIQIYCSDKLRDQAMREGGPAAVEKFEAEMRNVANQAVERGPLFGTDMNDTRLVPCEPAEKTLECLVHRHPDYRKCRYERRQAIWEQNQRDRYGSQPRR